MNQEGIMKPHRWILFVLLLAAACTTNFKGTGEDGDLDGQDLAGDELDTTVDGQDPVPDGTDTPPDGTDVPDAPDTPDGTGCGEGEIDCTGVCVNPAEDRNNCGNCGIECSDVEECVEGTCRCRMGLELCNEECVNLTVDNRHCGACNEPCPADSDCTDGDCICVTGLTMCDNVCVNTSTSLLHCGECDHPCAELQVCNNGDCASDCGTGLTRCPGPPPYCADLNTDPQNCNTCGSACPAPPANANRTCVDGSCGWECRSGFFDANGNPGDGCECQYYGDEACNGRDDDCNGTADDTFECVQYTFEACTLPSTDCNGQRQCGDGCTWGPCQNTAWVCDPGEVDSTCHPPISDLCPGTRSCAGNCLGWDECQDTCPSSEPECCVGGCTNVTVDPNNCGSCGRGCSSGLYCCDSDCRDCCEGAHCEPQCRGTAVACGSLSDPTTCDQVGCNWTTNTGCGGTPGGCGDYYNRALDCSNCGCTYSAPNCTGTPRACDTFTNQGPCETCGCGWMEYTTCDGTPRACDSFTAQTDCEGQEGCLWYVCTGYHCVPAT